MARPSIHIAIGYVLVCCAVVYYIYSQFTSGPVELVANGIQREPAKITVISNVDKADEYQKLGLTPHPSMRVETSKFKKTLHGRFLHITDMHPDMFYRQNTSYESACHSGDGDAPKYGAAMAGCDSPYVLVKETLDWIEEHLKDKIDFIIWTGDNVRHDNDRGIPRTEFQIFEVNQNISDLMTLKFKEHNTLDPREFTVPLIPSLGNNDVYPHNLFALGPTLQSRLLYKTWAGYIPQEQAHVFEKSASFLREVIPGQLAVLSINTLYLFKSNPLVDNCDNKKQPGYTLFVWLGFTLKELRRRGMKVWLSGHVPPVPKNFDVTCYRKFILWLYEYRDIIIGSVFGHMNLDHFVPLDAVAAYESLKSDYSVSGYEDLIANFQELLGDDETFCLEKLYKLDDPVGSRASAQLSSELHSLGAAPGTNKLEYMESVNELFYSPLVAPQQLKLLSDEVLEVTKKKKKKNKNKKKKKKKKKKKQRNDGTRYSTIHVAASIIPTFNPGFRVWEYNLTGLYGSQDIYSTTQNTYSATSLELWDEFFRKLDVKLEKIHSQDDYVNEYKEIFSSKQTSKKKPDKSFPPKSKKNLPLGPAFAPQTFTPTHFTQYYLDLGSVNSGEKPFSYEVEYTSKSLPYKMNSLLANDWVNLGIRLANAAKSSDKGQKMWNKYLERSFVSTGYEDLIRKNRDPK